MNKYPREISVALVFSGEIFVISDNLVSSSKGYGFVMFTRHEDALACLRKLNNNPDVFDSNNVSI